MTEVTTIPEVSDAPAAVDWASLKQPVLVATGHKTKKGETIYYSTRHNKEGVVKKSFFTMRDGPRKVYISQQSLVKNNMGFLTGSLK